MGLSAAVAEKMFKVGRNIWTRYSGQQNSRLAGNVSNTSKQTRFPTTWGESRKGSSDGSSQEVIDYTAMRNK